MHHYLNFRNTDVDAFGQTPTISKVRAAIHAQLADQDDMEIVPEAAIDASKRTPSSNTFESLLSSIASKKTQLPRDNAKNQIDVLFDEYRDAPLIPITEDPLMFWKEWQESGNPLKQKFSEVAVEKLTPPPSSVDAERLFSTAADVVKPDANRTNPENLEKKLFCRNNLPMVNFEY